jgi:hypothetical protein
MIEQEVYAIKIRKVNKFCLILPAVEIIEKYTCTNMDEKS